MEKKHKQCSRNQSINHEIIAECADFEAYSRAFSDHIVFSTAHDVENMFCLVIVEEMTPCKTPVRKCAFSSFRKREIIK